MMNPYDTDELFSEYSKMGRSVCGLSAAGEWSQMERLLTDLKGKEVLDLGCGYGWHARYAVEQGAIHVIGIDGSQKMLDKAMELTNDTRIEYKLEDMEMYQPAENEFDIVISNLALHYISDLEKIYEKVYQALKNGGYFVFNIEHPVFTSGCNQQFIEDNGTKLWPIDNYFIEEKRTTIFLGKEVVKYHHTLTTILNCLIKCGFRIDAIEEVQPDKKTIEANGWWDELKRPMMLLVKAHK